MRSLRHVVAAPREVGECDGALARPQRENEKIFIVERRILRLAPAVRGRAHERGIGVFIDVPVHRCRRDTECVDDFVDERALDDRERTRVGKIARKPREARFRHAALPKENRFDRALGAPV